MRDVVILGSTGSVGVQAIDIVKGNPDRFRVVGLAAAGSDLSTLAAQILDLGVQVVAIADQSQTAQLSPAVQAQARVRGYRRGEYTLPTVLAGPDAAAELATVECDIVLNGITGSIGLGPTLAALKAGRQLALANKESLIAGGQLVKDVATPGQIVPVDSEHSALAQGLRAGERSDVRRLILTASGGPFLGHTREQLATVTPAQALAHPTWTMGPVITINCATLVNKGLELIEAHLLFDIPYDAIDVVVHPQSVVHSMVEFVDGSTLAQASPPDMRLPIALALAWPRRVPAVVPAVDWTCMSTWEFMPLDEQAFPAVGLAREAGQRGGLAPAVYNAANEQCVAAFRAKRLAFTGIVDTIGRILGEYSGGRPASIDDVVAAEDWARARAQEIVASKEEG